MKAIITFIKSLLHKKKRVGPDIDPAYVITRAHHPVSKTEISNNALSVINRICKAGYQAYLVGGSVRDLLLRHAPKDFDIATSATPAQVKHLFKNARIIGRRFKLVHILFHREVLEVATFRGQEPAGQDAQQKINERGMLVRDNVYGTLKEDAWRRDFTINSLYYDIQSSSIIDYTGGVEDIKAKLVRMIGDPMTRYQEDPVRMLRAIRFAAKLSFNIEPRTAEGIHALHHLIQHISNSRLFDEAIKLYHSGAAIKVHQQLKFYHLFSYLFPQTDHLSKTTHPVEELIQLALKSTDKRLKENKPVTPAFLFAVFLWFPMLEHAAYIETEKKSEPLDAIEQAMSYVLSLQCKTIMIPKRHLQVIREIWLLQFRFNKRTGQKPYQLLEHPRFRAAYDLLCLRATAKDEEQALADWWTAFQIAPPGEQEKMINGVKKKS